METVSQFQHKNLFGTFERKRDQPSSIVLRVLAAPILAITTVATIALAAFSQRYRSVLFESWNWLAGRTLFPIDKASIKKGSLIAKTRKVAKQASIVPSKKDIIEQTIQLLDSQPPKSPKLAPLVPKSTPLPKIEIYLPDQINEPIEQDSINIGVGAGLLKTSDYQLSVFRNLLVTTFTSSLNKVFSEEPFFSETLLTFSQLSMEIQEKVDNEKTLYDKLESACFQKIKGWNKIRNKPPRKDHYGDLFPSFEQVFIATLKKTSGKQQRQAFALALFNHFLEAFNQSFSTELYYDYTLQKLGGLITASMSLKKTVKDIYIHVVENLSILTEEWPCDQFSQQPPPPFHTLMSMVPPFSKVYHKSQEHLKKAYTSLSTCVVKEPPCVYLGQISDKWQFPSSHLPVGASIKLGIEQKPLQFASYNVLSNADPYWFKGSWQGLYGSSITTLDQPSTESNLTLREELISDQVVSMFNGLNKRTVVALQGCSQPLFGKLMSALIPQGICGIVPQSNYDTDYSNPILYDSHRLDFIDHKVSHPFSLFPKSIHKITFKDKQSGQLIIVLNVDVHAGQYKMFTEYFKKTQQYFGDTMIVAMGTMNASQGAIKDELVTPKATCITETLSDITKSDVLFPSDQIWIHQPTYDKNKLYIAKEKPSDFIDSFQFKIKYQKLQNIVSLLGAH